MICGDVWLELVKTSVSILTTADVDIRLVLSRDVERTKILQDVLSWRLFDTSAKPHNVVDIWVSSDQDSTSLQRLVLTANDIRVWHELSFTFKLNSNVRPTSFSWVTLGQQLTVSSVSFKKHMEHFCCFLSGGVQLQCRVEGGCSLQICGGRKHANH